MKLTFHGQACFVVEADGHTIVIDPFLTGNPTAVAKPEDIRCEAVLLTHGHSDHVADAEAIAKANDALIIAPNELAMIYGQRGCKVHPMHLGGARTFPFGRVKLTIAFHGSAFEDGNNLLYAGNPCGFLITMGGKTFYHAGDTALFGDMKLLGELNHIDVAALPIGDNFTMGPEDALLAAEWLKAGRVIPIHYNTFDLIRQDADAFVRALADKGLRGTVVKPGETIEV
ncbi:metal-dependent hydrolase [Alicyclobacillus herbarius]|uniref:metal-dependent hydrolase n=1 Tax=Alicyclobacillus herbarius TaxID=122960 RepID=UPI00047892D6|nr:metal-dependent hydrolase [Alicyclobacillus herbarius]